MPHFVAGDGAKIAYRDAGRGLPVLCLAGLTRSMDDFDYLAPHLPDLRLIRMDYRGRGQSDHTGAATYTVPQEAKDALALLDHLGIGKATLLGTSRGGLIGLWLADARKHYDQTPDGLQIRYDPALREAFLAAFDGEAPDLWPLWRATEGLPVALIRGANSDLLSPDVAARMRSLRPDTIFAEVPDRAHVPWLDEPESLSVLRRWIAAIQG